MKIIPFNVQLVKKHYLKLHFKLEILDKDEEPGREPFENKYFTILPQLKQKCINLSTHVSNVAASSKPVGFQNETSNQYVRLPQIQMQNFSGEVTQWNSFIQIFSSLIENNSDLSNVLKLIY